MTAVKEIIEKREIDMTDLQIKHLTYIIEDMETEFNAEEEEDDDDFALHDMYLDEDNELVILCLDIMVQHSTTVDHETLDKLNTECSETELNEIATSIKIGIT